MQVSSSLSVLSVYGLEVKLDITSRRGPHSRIQLLICPPGSWHKSKKNLDTPRRDSTSNLPLTQLETLHLFISCSFTVYVKLQAFSHVFGELVAISCCPNHRFENGSVYASKDRCPRPLPTASVQRTMLPNRPRKARWHAHPTCTHNLVPWVRATEGGNSRANFHNPLHRNGASTRICKWQKT